MTENPKIQMNFNSSVTGAAGYLAGNQINNIYPSDQKQTLAEAAAEIQNLLKQLNENNLTASDVQQKAYVTAAIAPRQRQRFVNALQAGWQEAIKEFLDNAYINIAIAILEGWTKE